MDTILVTGAAGFIGSNFVRTALAKRDVRVVVFDKLTYAGSQHNLDDLAGNPRYAFLQADIADAQAVEMALRQHQPRWVVNFAAETHVDRSIEDPRDFVQTNIVGVYVLLEACRRHSQSLSDSERRRFRLLHVSTDEVYGSLGATGLFSETTSYAPNSPYAASKASADHLVRAYHHTYRLPTLITNCSNNYGPYQFPEKLIPLMLLNALEGKKLPIYGDGGNVRDWLYVEDHCEAIWLVLERAAPGEQYNIGGHNERTNLQIVDTLCAVLERLKPAAGNAALTKQSLSRYEQLKTFVADRPGHDRRYAIDAAKIQRDLGWTPKHDFASGLERTVQWYLEHLDWCEAVQEGQYRRERLGLGAREGGKS